MSDRLTMKIVVPLMDLRPKPRITTNIKREHWGEILTGFLRSQMGKGEDKALAVERDQYEITIQLDVSTDTFYVKHDCGNKGLRDGILMEVLGCIAKGNVLVEE